MLRTDERGGGEVVVLNSTLKTFRGHSIPREVTFAKFKNKL